ncbi:MAG: hypothetical protein ACP5MT_02460 [Candidatus Acidifodinimicrobium sp.]
MENRKLKRAANANERLSLISKALYRYRTYIILAYFLLLVLFFSLQFNLLQNWDMIVRVLNANYLFHNGFYFENQRALLESFVIGLLSYPLGGYAVYGFLAVATILLMYALYGFSKAFKIEFLILMLAFFNPLTVMYIAKNGSEIFLISFLLLYLAAIKRRRYSAGLFLALAFLSKYDALYFSPLLLFLILNGRVSDSIKRILVSIAVFLVSLIPYFVYNLLTYGNAIYTFALSYLYYLNVGALPSFNYTGLIELLIPLALAMFIFSSKKNRWEFSRKAKRLKFELSLLSASFIIGLYTYFAANGFFLNNLGVYRFALLPTSLLSVIILLFSNKEDLLKIFIFSALSMILAFYLLASSIPAYSPLSIAYEAKSLFVSLYNTTNCTVMSNDWVYLDYAGLPASPILPTPGYNDTPIISLGVTNTSLPLIKSKGNIYLYGYGYCREHKVQYNFLTDYNAILKSRNATLIPDDPCDWLFNEKLKSNMLLEICEKLT